MKNMICFGDSITDCGHLFGAAPLGDGYVYLLNERLKKEKKDTIVINKGFDGFTAARVLRVAEGQEIPSDSVCTLLVGINDVAMIFYNGLNAEEQERLFTRFARYYEKIICEIQKSTHRLILMEPFLFPCPAEFELWLPSVRIMSQLIGKLADQYQLPYLKLHDRLNALAQDKGFDALTIDGVHLTRRGHQVIADELYKLL